MYAIFGAELLHSFESIFATFNIVPVEWAMFMDGEIYDHSLGSSNSSVVVIFMLWHNQIIT